MNIVVIKDQSDLPGWIDIDTLAEFLHETMKPYEDTIPDIMSALNYAFSDDPGRGGFLVLAEEDHRLQGAALILDTGMSGYVPPNILLFIAVRPGLRGRGIGSELMNIIKETCEGDIKLHVEHDNPARRLYERHGFTSKYLEMRWSEK